MTNANTETTRIKVDVWSDIACPWCFIGKRRLDMTIAEMSTEVEVEVEYHSFELAPDTPETFEGSEIDFLAGHKRMPRERVEEMLAQVTQIAADEGLTYDFDRLRHTKTLRAHEVLHLAKERGVQGAAVERLLLAYFSEGVLVSDVDELVRLGEDVGLDAAEVRAALEDGRYADAVARDVVEAQRLGIQGVPFYVVDGRYGISGAQPSAVFAQVFEQVLAERAAVPGA